MTAALNLTTIAPANSAAPNRTNVDLNDDARSGFDDALSSRLQTQQKDEARKSNETADAREGDLGLTQSDAPASKTEKTSLEGATEGENDQTVEIESVNEEQDTVSELTVSLSDAETLSAIEGENAPIEAADAAVNPNETSADASAVSETDTTAGLVEPADLTDETADQAAPQTAIPVTAQAASTAETTSGQNTKTDTIAAANAPTNPATPSQTPVQAPTQTPEGAQSGLPDNAIAPEGEFDGELQVRPTGDAKADKPQGEPGTSTQSASANTTTAANTSGDSSGHNQSQSNAKSPIEALLAMQARAQAATPVEIQIEPLDSMDPSSLDLEFEFSQLRTDTRLDGVRAANQLAHAARFTPQTVQTLAARIAQGVGSGASTIDIRLDPPELGRVEVRLELGPENTVRAVLAAERPETLSELERTSEELENALADSGLDLENDGLEFTLMDEDSDEDDLSETDSDALLLDALNGSQNAQTTPTPALYGFDLKPTSPLNLRV